MLFRKLLKDEDYRSHLGVGQTCLGIGVLGMVLGMSRILDYIISNESVLDFSKGLFVGLSSCLIVYSIILSIQSLIYLKRQKTD
ncbi:MAG: hypothetical protein WCC06_03600 [Candidatus Aminicenantales bacterium]